MAVVNRIAGFAEEMTGWRRHLHMFPELCLQCHETARFVVARLRDMGITEIHEGIATSGVVAVIEGQGPGPVTGLRADMDALPMQEETGAQWASTVPGRMHACGHDGHTAMLLGAAKYLSETRRFAGRVVLIFQPAEESVGGGRIMVEEGIMDRFGVEEVYALHTDPFGELGEFRTCPGPIMGSVDDFTLRIRGQGGHAAYPQTCRDPMPAALAIGQALQTVVSRNTDPLGSLVVSLTMVHGGTASNIIPEEVTLGGTVRSLTPQVRDMAEDRIRRIATRVAEGYDVEALLDYRRSYPPTINHDEQTRFAVDIAREVSSRVVDDLPPEMGAEDFSYMLEARPGAFLFLGQGIGPSAHHPAFDFNDAVAPIGASFFARLIEKRHALG
ncbi:hippurate hydrolase [Mameliella alba]|uniref:M20 aminoacylase family protein n=1 Tax=Mameliella alba TaxID=561184 RepID=UPI0008845A8A|nr:M20 aminoacylase family protein [Mameliella alba]OWV49640.1 amidohydrolase [Mameliella alba]PTR41621.1 hippurate hydrolase [Mameliella alba]GGF53079.1 amidohydrolase [Mameliella alba]SDC36180.1 hippurate hydrolase [Mameliella alba]